MKPGYPLAAMGVLVVLCLGLAGAAFLRADAIRASNVANQAQWTWSINELSKKVDALGADLREVAERIGDLEHASVSVQQRGDSGDDMEAQPPRLPDGSKLTRNRAHETKRLDRLAGDRGRDDTPVPLMLQLPKPMFVGTPRNITSPNLGKITGRMRPPFMAPKDVTNVAAGKPVTSSDPRPIIGDLSMITDQDKEGADGSFVELAPGVQWVQVDLGAPKEIFAILFWHYHSQARVYHDVIVQASDDPDFAAGVTTLFNNDHDNTAKLGAGQDKEYIETSEGRLVDAHGLRARYVRLYSNGNTSDDSNHLIEVEVYGR